MEAFIGFFGTFFVFGNFWFWISCIAFFSGLISLSDYDQNFWASIITLGFFIGIYHFNNLIINWSLVPWAILGYLILGVMMSFIKWITYLKLRASEYANLKEEWIIFIADSYIEKYGNAAYDDINKNTNLKSVLTLDEYDAFKARLKRSGFINLYETRIIPLWKDKYKKLISWALWWPAVMVWSLLNDHIRNAFSWIIKALRKWYETLAIKIFAKVGVDIKDNDVIY